MDGYSQLAAATNDQLSDGQLETLRNLAADPAIDPENRAVAWFTTGDVHHRRQEHDRAFEAWKQANDLKQTVAASWAGSSYHPRETEELVDFLAPASSKFRGGASARSGGADAPLHRRDAAIGDNVARQCARRAWRRRIRRRVAGHARRTERVSCLVQGRRLRGGAIPAPVAAQLRDKYLQQYRTYGIAGAAFVTDKQPLNFWSVGLIRHLFPAAPIIHIRRSALETGFSIYRKNFHAIVALLHLARAYRPLLWPICAADGPLGGGCRRRDGDRAV